MTLFEKSSNALIFMQILKEEKQNGSRFENKNHL